MAIWFFPLALALYMAMSASRSTSSTSVSGIGNDYSSDAGSDRQRLTIVHEALSQAPQSTVGEHARIPVRRKDVEEHHELVATEPGHHVGVTCGRRGAVTPPR